MKQRIHLCTTQDGVRIAYATMGEGPAIVKVSNWMSHLEFDRDSPVWRHWLRELSRANSLVRYDGRGCGLSDREMPAVTFETWINDLASVIDAAGLERFVLLGISQGAAIAIAYAVRYPEKVSHLIAYGGYLRGRFKREITPRQRREAELRIDLAELGWGKEEPAFRQFFTTQFLPGGSAEQHRWFNELERVSTSPENAVRFMRVLYNIDVTALAPRIACPALVLHSNGDAVVPFEEGRLMASMIPGARFVPLDSRNHILLEHEPAWNRWVEEVRSFLPAASGADSVFAALTGRERELVELLAQGLDNAQIAAHLALSEKTVRNHITSIFSKLEVENRGQAIVLARDNGFGRTPR